MQISSRLTIAVHVLTCISVFEEEHKITGDFLAASVNVNPVVIRRLMQQLKNAGIVTVIRGSGGAVIAKPPSEITLLDIYRAVDCLDNGELFHFHENPNAKCPVGNNIHKVLDDRLEQIQAAMENEMKKISIADIIADAKQNIEK